MTDVAQLLKHKLKLRTLIYFIPYDIYDQNNNTHALFFFFFLKKRDLLGDI